MDFTTIAKERQSCRAFDRDRQVEEEKLEAVLQAARLAPSACNAQPYFLTVCEGEMATKVEKATMAFGMNQFADKAPVAIVISEMPYNKTASVGAKVKGNDYRSVDIGILAAHISSEATAQGLGSCIIGWLEEEKIQKLCQVDGTVRLVVLLGYAKEGDKLREKKRKSEEQLWKRIK